MNLINEIAAFCFCIAVSIYLFGMQEKNSAGLAGVECQIDIMVCDQKLKNGVEATCRVKCGTSAPASDKVAKSVFRMIYILFVFFNFCTAAWKIYKKYFTEPKTIELSIGSIIRFV